MIRRHHIVILLLCIFPAGMFGQSVYSSLGIGEPMLPETGRSASMGLQGIALSDQRGISLANPALWHEARYTGIGTGLNTFVNSTSLGGHYNSFSFQGFNFHLPLAKSVGAAIGFAPYTQVDYNFLRENNQQVFSGSAGSDTLRYSLESRGAGGVGGNFIGVGWEIMDRFAVGAAMSFLLGQVDTDQRLQFESPEDLLDRQITKDTHVSGENLVVGGSAKGLLKPADHLAFRVEVPLRLEVESTESVYSGVTTPAENLHTYSEALWPNQYGLSYAFPALQNLLVAAEGILWQPQTDLPSLTAISGGYEYNTGLQLGAGVEYSLNPDSYVWYEKLALRSGIHWRKFMITNSSGAQPVRWTWSGGVGFPFGQGNRIDLAVTYGHRSGFESGDPVEDLIGVRFGFVLNELWFDGGIRNQ